MKINRLQTLYFMFFLLAFSKSILAADFLSESGCKYLIENLVGDSYVAIGARVKIRKESSGEVTNAFFLGKRGNRLHYLTKEKSPKKFYIDLAPENNSIRFEEIVESIEQVESICSPLSALSCLRVLNQQNGLPTEIQKRLEIEPEKLLEEMIDEFGQETLQNRDKLGELEAGEHDGRRQQHDLIRGFLAKNGVRSESTMSYRKLIAHLKKKLPAIISVHVATKILFEPSLDDDWQEPVLIYDKSCPGSKSYFSFTDEFINQEQKIGS